MVEEAVKSYRVAYERDGRAGEWPPCAVYAAATRRVAPSTRLGAASETRWNCSSTMRAGPHRGRREAAESRHKGNSGLREASQEGRRRRPTGSSCGSTRRSRIANRQTEDERARCGSSPGAVASARSPAHATGRKPIGPHATLSSGWHQHTQALTRSRQLLSERVAAPVLLAEIRGPSQELGRTAIGRSGDARRDEQQRRDRSAVAWSGRGSRQVA